MYCKKKRCQHIIEETAPPEYLPDGLLSPSFWLEIRSGAKDLARLASVMEKAGDTICTLSDVHGKMLAFARIEGDLVTEFYIHLYTRDASLRGLCRCAVRFIKECHHGDGFHDNQDHKEISYAA